LPPCVWELFDDEDVQMVGSCVHEKLLQDLRFNVANRDARVIRPP
jgi:hypothetical protein